MNESSHLTNEMLIMRLKQNIADEFSFMLLVDRFIPLLKKFAYKMPIDGYEPEDIVQEGVILMYRVIQHYNPAYGGYFAPYFERSMYNYLVNLLRRNAKDAETIRFGMDAERDQIEIGDSIKHQSLSYDYKIATVPELQVIVNEEKERYYASLSPFERQIIYCYSHLSMKPKEIAEYLGIDRNRVKNALRRAKDKLKAIIAE
ncbi:sigma-70 family RNA polymerase sigma factor [Facklamia miroungae]|uniref:RNA polymerase sigma factor, sigma-70 family n=1 Tax=Facklamia miroungae TaxID=120956 RepID=A0A1G7SXD5_9LACT|nr:sigma-70 family RNA polymerase sigma factor [Facklamia miroungae]NKZ29522.1 sigma-70 family RNA polymerase sigma factor [Facklamia miroungae]SDG26960.1 RNA polymerase sigma factor, sigma-70 family [Facklamia miroungae]